MNYQEEIAGIKMMITPNTSFWDRVHDCDHKNHTDYFSSYTMICNSDYCSPSEVRCSDCGVYIFSCPCGAYGLSGWSYGRNRTHRIQSRAENK